MRERVTASLGGVPYDEFLVYLMGPYTTFEVETLVPKSAEGGDVSLPSAEANPDGVDEMMATLRRVQGSLRADPGVNAFLAVDVDVSLEEMDAATQSIEFARASNAIVFVVPRLGSKLGVGIELGAVLEAIYPDEVERALLVHEDDISSAMLGALPARWEARVETYADEAELVAAVRQFVYGIMTREQFGDLERRSD